MSITNDLHERWFRFAAIVSARLAKGREDYGDASFSADPERLLDELQQETADIAGWGFILWSRLQAMREALRDEP